MATLAIMLISFLAVLLSSTTAAPPSEYQILMELYAATNGEQWYQNSGWDNKSLPICSWYGVHCLLNGTVTSLILVNNNLSGEIPSSLGSLANIQLLDLPNNNLSGEIPTTIGSLAKLRSLFLNNNHLTGEIPSDIGSLPSLQFVDLSSNSLTGEIPSSLGSLPNLQYLYLESNNLTSIGFTSPPPAFLGRCDFASNPFKCPVPSWAATNCGATCTWVFCKCNKFALSTKITALTAQGCHFVWYFFFDYNTHL